MENLRQVSFGEFNFANIVWSSKNKSTFYCCQWIFQQQLLSYWQLRFGLLKSYFDEMFQSIRYIFVSVLWNIVIAVWMAIVNTQLKYAKWTILRFEFSTWYEIVKAHFKIEIPQLQSEFSKSIGSCHLV